ncbi:MAG: hypothetical protein V2J24_18845 [Pseudomonadales bacterium]|jgi:hypothetical protein|nr:hypothetical protein [Pseudomonadales bacterium]
MHPSPSTAYAQVLALLLLLVSQVGAAQTFAVEVRRSAAAPCAGNSAPCLGTAVEPDGDTSAFRYGTNAPTRPMLYLAVGGEGEIRRVDAGADGCFYVPRRGVLVERCGGTGSADLFEVALLAFEDGALRLRVALARSGERFASELDVVPGHWTPFARDTAGRRVEVRASPVESPAGS